MKPIWFGNVSLADIGAFEANSFSTLVGIEFTEIGVDYLCGRMLVNAREHQSFCILHGGASAVLAETLGSVAANFVVDRRVARCVGQFIRQATRAPYGLDMRVVLPGQY